MSKGNPNSSQRLLTRRPGLLTREKPPIPFTTKAGIELRCPFCDDHHQLMPNVESPCGTRIEVMAVQNVISARLAREKGLVCIKCNQDGGEFVKYRNSFIHLENCSPGTRLLQELPKSSLFARLVYGIHPRVRGLIERYTGRADQIQEIDNFGKKTGKIVGYFFYKTMVKEKA